ARSLVASLGSAVLDLPVEDPGIVADIDTPEEYRRHFGRAPSEYVQQTSDSGAARHERLAHERGAARASPYWTPRPRRWRRAGEDRPWPWSRGCPGRKADPRPGSWSGRTARSRARSGTASWTPPASPSAARRWSTAVRGP